jgi:dihydroorotate dehydrogenase (fumarate)
MINLKTKYMGIELKNPLVVGASYLVSNTDNLKQLEEAGAAAIVYKSLFEEQIQLEKVQLDNELDEYTERNAEMITLFPHIEHAGPEEYLHNIRKAKESVSIPVFASLNAIYKETWIEYAKLLEQTGVDGIELNFYSVPKNADLLGASIEKQQIEIFQEIKKAVKIPISVKLSPYYSNCLNFIAELDKAKVNGLVLFNRFYQPDIDIETLTHVAGHSASSADESKLALRYAGLLFGNVKASIICNSGIHQGSDIIKMILAGADAVQVVSTIYKNKIPHVSKMLKDVEAWMYDKNFSSLTDFKGKLSKNNTNDPFVYQRAQYIDLLLKSGDLFNKYALR